MTELSIHTASTELAGGRVLRVSRVDKPRGDGETVVLEKLTGSYAARSLLEPSNGDRLTLDADELDTLQELLAEVGG